MGRRLLLLLAATAAAVQAQPPSCAPVDSSIIFQATVPNAPGALPPPFVSVLCNGFPCPLSMGMEAALVGTVPFDTCGGSTSVIAGADDLAPLFKQVTLEGSSGQQFVVQSLEDVSSVSVGPLDTSTQGSGVVSILSYTDVYFRPPIQDMATGSISCPFDAVAGDALLIETPFGALPAFEAAMLPEDPVSGQPLVCLYACTSKVATQMTELDCSGVPVGTSTSVPVMSSASDFTFSPLSNTELACDVTADLGPFVTPTTMFPAVVNGMPAGPLCMSPGQQLGAFVGTSPLSQCCNSPPCEEDIDLVVDSTIIEKTFLVQGVPVESNTTLSFSDTFTTLITVPNFQSRFTLYQWTSTYFNCQNPDGSCPVDPDAVIGPLSVESGLSDFFDGICPMNADNMFDICVYACLKHVVVECTFECNDIVPPQLGQLFEVEPVIISAEFPMSGAQSISDPHFKGFKGQPYDFQGVAGQIYHMLSDEATLISERNVWAVNARFGQSFTTRASMDTIEDTKFSAVDGATWMTDAGIQIGQHCVIVSGQSSSAHDALSEFSIAYGSVQVDGQEVTRLGSYDLGGSSLRVQNMKSFAHVSIVGDLFAMSFDIVPPPKAWDVNADMVDEHTHINIKVDRIHLLHGLGVLGMSALDKNAEIDGSALQAREADFRMSELCSIPPAGRLELLQ